MDKTLTIKEKILAFLADNGIKKGDFFNATGIQPSNFKGRNMESWPGGEMLVKVLTQYPDLSAEWLMRGVGEMYRQEDTGEPIIKGNSELIDIIREQAEEIGRLKQQIEQLKRRRGDNAGDVRSSGLASVG